MPSEIQPDKSPAGQILKLLQEHRNLSIKEIEIALGVTATAVRQPLATLMAAGVVVAETVREKRGRPHAVYRLASKGQALFARGYEELALALLEETLRWTEPALAGQLLHRVSARLSRQYAEQMPGVAMAERLQALATWLTTQGVTSKVDEVPEAFVLTEYGCPYYGVAREHREVCDMELEAIQLALGSPVTLAQSQLDGYHGCQFQVKKAPA